MSSALRLGFLGAGKMATALAKGFIHAGLVPSNQVLASDPFETARNAIAEQTGARTSTSNSEVLQFADVLLLAVKPDTAGAVLKELHESWSSRHLLISIAAGVTIARLEKGLPSGARVVRVMPNTPALVGASASAFATGSAATREDCELTQQLFTSVGLALEVPETLLDAVTGLSGSGPAYAFLMLEALSDGGVAAGLPRDIATKLAAQTLLGSAQMLLQTGMHPGALKDMVTSPGGTTIEGIHQLEKGGVRRALIEAVRAAADKAKKLGEA